MSDSYDPEFGTSSAADDVREALQGAYESVSYILGHSPPMPINQLMSATLPTHITATLTEFQWRLIRFAVERAIDSV